MADVRVTQEYIDIFHNQVTNPDVRVTQTYAETFHSQVTNPDVRVTQTYVEAFHNQVTNPDVRVTQAYAEVFHSQPLNLVLTGVTPLSRGRTFATGGILSVEQDVFLAGVGPLSRTHVFPVNGFVQGSIFSNAPLARAHVFPSDGVLNWDWTTQLVFELAKEFGVSTNPAIIVVGPSVEVEKALRFEYFPRAGVVTGEMTLTHLTSHISGRMPVAFLAPRRLTSTLDPSSDEYPV